MAVLGAFSLVRFRSVPGSSRDITLIFLAMGTGLATSMAYTGYALLLTAGWCARCFWPCTLSILFPSRFCCA